MQITSTLSQNKMEPNSGNSTAPSPTEPLSLSAAENVGGAFCHQFYITVSENRAAITKFYGHESKFYLEDQTVTGPQEIAKLYNNLPESTHFKIHSIKGFPTPHKQGVIINVIGTVNLRPFFQTFLLGQQGQKKYYVESDAFQYIDKFFDFNSDQEKPVSARGCNSASNGATVNVTQPAKVPEQPKELPKPVTPKQQTPKKAEETLRQPKQDIPKPTEKDVSQTLQHAEVIQPLQPQQLRPTSEPAQEPAKTRKTWANLVGGSSKSQSQTPQGFGQGQIHQQQPVHQIQQTAAIHHHQQAQAAQIYQQQRQSQQASHPANDLRQAQESSDANLNERKIYLGGITREIVPSNTAQAETEIKQVFYKYGEVEEVRMPRKVLDSPNDTSKHAFAFITMRNKTGVQAIFSAATRDEQGTWKLPLKLDAFGFDGHAQISEQRDQPPGGGFRGGRGGFPLRGGQFYRRGGSGGAPRGSLRSGGFQNSVQH